MDKIRIQVICNPKLVALLDQTAAAMGLSRSSLANYYLYAGLSETHEVNIKEILDRMPSEVGV